MKKFELGVCFGVPSFVSCGVPPPFTFRTPHACLLDVFFWGSMFVLFMLQIVLV